ncbi:hypothetical protein FACS1894207_2560 [Bacteroidia bacterium]|nr:hypothetical protein FACS1894207_2560 [Bacteroidia bacterium]
MDGDDAVAVDTVVAGRLAIDASTVDLDVFCSVQAIVNGADFDVAAVDSQG